MSCYNVVVIDDDPISLDMLCYSLEHIDNVSLIAYSDSFEAYQYFHHASPEDFDLVISDWKMPMLDGLELFKIIQRRFPDTQSLLVTAALPFEATDTIKQLGIDGLISKPFTTGAVTEKVLELLGLAKSA